MVSRLTNDLAFIQQAAQASMFSFVKDVLSAIALVVAMFYIDWMLTLIVVAIYPDCDHADGQHRQAPAPVSHRTQTQLGDTTSRLTENLAGARLIKAFRLENYAIGRLNENFEEVFQLRMKSVRTRARAAPALEALAGAAVAGIIGFAYWRIVNGVSTVGDFMGFVAALLMVAQPLRSLGNIATSTMEGLAAADRMYELLDEKPTIVDRPGAKPLAITSGTIEFDRVGFSYASAAGLLAVTRLLAERAGRQDGRPRGSLRRRQDDHHQSGGAPVRRRLRPHIDRWPGSARRDAWRASGTRWPSSARR